MPISQKRKRSSQLNNQVYHPQQQQQNYYHIAAPAGSDHPAVSSSSSLLHHHHHHNSSSARAAAANSSSLDPTSIFSNHSTPNTNSQFHSSHSHQDMPHNSRSNTNASTNGNATVYFNPRTGEASSSGASSSYGGVTGSSIQQTNASSSGTNLSHHHHHHHAPPFRRASKKRRFSSPTVSHNVQSYPHHYSQPSFSQHHQSVQQQQNHTPNYDNSSTLHQPFHEYSTMHGLRQQQQQHQRNFRPHAYQSGNATHHQQNGNQHLVDEGSLAGQSPIVLYHQYNGNNDNAAPLPVHDYSQYNNRNRDASGYGHYQSNFSTRGSNKSYHHEHQQFGSQQQQGGPSGGDVSSSRAPPLPASHYSNSWRSNGSGAADGSASSYSHHYTPSTAPAAVGAPFHHTNNNKSTRSRRHHNMYSVGGAPFHHKSTRSGTNNFSHHYSVRYKSNRHKHHSKQNHTAPHDDKEGHYRFSIGEVLSNQYKIVSFMGAGTFAKVVKCVDIYQNRHVAIKIIRSLRKYTEAAKIEINVLNDIKDRDQKDQFHCIRLLRSFTFRGHVCLVFPLYGTSIFDFIKKNLYLGFSLRDIQNIARQFLQGIRFIHEDLRLIHTDLKPENILLVNGEFSEISLPSFIKPKRQNCTTLRVPKCTDIKIIDFGSATYERDYHTAIISTRHYRAPEVILGLGWSYPADMWSIGCILFELYTGDALFQTHENKEHLAMMEKYFGMIPREIYRRTDRSCKKKYFTSSGRLNWPNMATNNESISFVEKLKSLDDSLQVDQHGAVGEAFLDLILRLLRYEADDRLTATEALNHEFFSMEF